MTGWALPKKLRVFAITVVTLPLALYLVLFVMEAYSSRQASRILDRVEALRIGDSEKDFERAVQGCPVTTEGSKKTCFMWAGAFRFQLPWRLLYKLPTHFADRVYGVLLRAGLRDWKLRISADIGEGRIRKIAASTEVMGRSEILGSSWQIADHIPMTYNDHLSPDQQLTSLHWYHITSLPVSGEGFAIDATPGSTEKELTARHVNRGCLLSSGGCDGLCEMLPDAVPVLRERKQNWGGWTSMSPTKCDKVLQ